MGTTSFTGPLHSSGAMQPIPASVGSPVPDPNQDAGPSMLYQGWALPDPRYIYLKDKVQGYTGVVPMTLDSGKYIVTNAVPAAAADANIAALANVVNGTAMTLVTAQAAGISPAIPIIPFSAGLNTGTVVNALALDFGFAFGNCTAASATIQVADSTQFAVGMPLVIGGVGNAAGTSALLTQVASIVDATHITVISTAVPAASNATAPIGTGNLWGPSENGFPLPTAALPYMAAGPGLFLDPRQSITRTVKITGAAGSAGGNFLVSGYDVYGQAMSQLVTVGAASSAFTTKAFKYIASVTPQFSDAHNYSVGTSDVYGFDLLAPGIENTAIWWNGLLNTASTGFTAPVATSPATNLTGDVRGTIQTSTAGPGSGIGATVSNGVITGLVMTGVRLCLAVSLGTLEQIFATPTNPAPLYGVTQA